MAIGRTNAMSIPATGKYIRPSDWLEIDSLVTAGEQKFVGLYAVFSDATLATNGANNYLSVTITGNCTIDWGDGVVENYASGVKADHLYTYASLSDSTICSRGYKQAIVTITPQSGQNITQYNLSSKHSSIVNYYTTHNWLDVNVSGTAISRILFFDRAKCIFLEKFRGYQSTTACTNMSNMFYNCTSAQYFNLSSFNTTSVTSMFQMFASCYSTVAVNLSQTNLNSVTDNSSIMNQMYSMSVCRLPNISKTFSVASSLMTATALNDLFGDLKDLTGFTAQTITITGATGAATCNKTIATNKNWVVVS